MKNRLSLLVLMLTFICLAASGQKNNNTPKSPTPTEISLQDSIQSLQVAISSLHDSIQSVQSAYYTQKDSINASLSILLDSIQSLQVKIQKLDVEKQMNQLEKEFEKYRWDFGQSVDNYNDKIAIWLAIITLIIAAFGIAIPYNMNSKNEKYMEKLLQDAKDKADKAENALNDLQPKVKKAEGVVTTIEGLKGNVDEAAKKAKAIQYFIQALQESDENRAIALYDKCIGEDKEFAEAYNNRGFLKHKINGPDASKEAMSDYDNAIKLIEKQDRGIYAEAYNNRGILYFENQEFDKAKEDFDAAISQYYAEAYLNLGLLKYAKGDRADIFENIDKAIELKPNFAEAYYIRGLFKLVYWFLGPGDEDIKKAKEFKPNVIEAYPNRNQLTGEIKEWDNSFNGVEYSRDIKTLIRVPYDKQGIFKIPNRVAEIGVKAFLGCTEIKSYDVEKNNSNYCSIDGVLYSIDKCLLIRVPCDKGSFRIPDSVTEIFGGAFEGCINLTSIVIPERVTKIGVYAFRGCTNLTSIVIPNSVNEIGHSAFEGCTSLPSIVIPDSVTEIKLSAFEECTSLSSIVIPKSVTVIGDNAFAGCTTLTSIVIPDSVTEFGRCAFSGCTSLTSIVIPKNLTKIWEFAFNGCTSFTSIVIPDSVTEIGYGAFFSSSKKIHLKHTSPVDFSKAFKDINVSKITLYVPKGSLKSYKDSGYYSGFKIEEDQS